MAESLESLAEELNLGAERAENKENERRAEAAGEPNTAPKKRGRGRPKGSKNKPKQSEETIEAEAEVIDDKGEDLLSSGLEAADKEIAERLTDGSAELGPDLAEFPDLSKEPGPEDIDFAPVTDEDEEEDDEENEGEEIAESEEDDEASVLGDGGDFDAEAFVREVEAEMSGKKTSELRKAYTREKALRRAKEQEVEAARKEAAATLREAERIREEAIASRTDVAPAPIEEYAPYREVVDRYTAWLKRSERRIKSGEVRQRLSHDTNELRAHAAQIEMLTGEEYDDARAQFERTIEDRYEGHADQVIRLIDEAAEFELEAGEIRQKYEEEVGDRAAEWARENYAKRSSGLVDRLISTFAVPEDKIEENPFTLSSHVARLLKDPHEGTKIEELLKGDIRLLHKVLNGPEPFQADDRISNKKDVVEAKKLWVEESDRLAQIREEEIPRLALEGLMARRLFPYTLKQLADSQNKSSKYRPAPTPSRKATGKKKAKKVTRESLTSDLEAALNAMG